MSVKNAINFCSNLEAAAAWAMNNIDDSYYKVPKTIANEFAIAVRWLSREMYYHPEDDENLYKKINEGNTIKFTVTREEFIRCANQLAEWALENTDDNANKVPGAFAYYFDDVMRWLEWYIDFEEDCYRLTRYWGYGIGEDYDYDGEY